MADVICEQLDRAKVEDLLKISSEGAIEGCGTVSRAVEACGKGGMRGYEGRMQADDRVREFTRSLGTL